MPHILFVNGMPCKAIKIDSKVIAKDGQGKYHRMQKDHTWKSMRVVQPIIKQAFEG